MKEFSFNLSPMLRGGLRPEVRAALNEQFCEDVFNIVGSQHGLMQPTVPTDPFNGVQAVSYPFPQIIRLRDESFLMGASSMKRISEASSPWTAAAITPYSIADGVTPQAISGSDVWHVADLGGAWYLFNGTTTIFKHGIEELHGGASKIFAQSDIPISTGCYHAGRVITGGFVAGSFWSAEWEQILGAFQGFGPEELAPGTSDIGQNYILWSSIGGGDFPLFLFFPDLYNYDLYSGQADATTAARRNTFGFMPMPFRGKVLCILPLGNGIVVYGEDGVVIMRPFENNFAAGYAPVQFLPIGPYSRGAVAGDDRQHLFLDTSGNLRVVTKDGITRLGFSEFMFDELGSNLRMWYDPHMEDFYISGTRSWLFNRYGLYETKEKACSVGYVDGGLLGLTATSPTVHEEVFDLTFPDAGYLTSNAFDFGLRSLKSVTGVSIAHHSENPVWVSFLYRYTSRSDFNQTRWVPLNKEGHATLRVTAVEFKLAIKVQDVTDLRIDHAYVRWQSSDKRNIRGFMPQASVMQQGESDGSSSPS